MTPALVGHGSRGRKHHVDGMTITQGELRTSEADAGKARSAPAETAFVEFVDVAKTYDGEVLAVDALNLHIAKGEFITLLGPSGSGKTT